MLFSMKQLEFDLSLISIPAICNVAFWLTAIPAVLFASHQYTPASCSRLFCITLEMHEIEEKRNENMQNRMSKVREWI